MTTTTSLRTTQKNKGHGPLIEFMFKTKRNFIERSIIHHLTLFSVKFFKALIQTDRPPLSIWAIISNVFTFEEPNRLRSSAVTHRLIGNDLTVTRLPRIILSICMFAGGRETNRFFSLQMHCAIWQDASV